MAHPIPQPALAKTSHTEMAFFHTTMEAGATSSNPIIMNPSNPGLSLYNHTNIINKNSKPPAQALPK